MCIRDSYEQGKDLHVANYVAYGKTADHKLYADEGYKAVSYTHLRGPAGIRIVELCVAVHAPRPVLQQGVAKDVFQVVMVMGLHHGHNFTVEAYMYPEEFEACDGLAAPVKGIRIGQQKRKAFGLDVYKRQTLWSGACMCRTPTGQADTTRPSASKSVW